MEDNVESLERCIQSVLDTILHEVKKEESFEGTVYYGWSFACLFLNLAWIPESERQRTTQKLMNKAKACEVPPSEQHGEFNAYAWAELWSRTNHSTFKYMLKRVRFQHNANTNWILLRAVAMARMDEYRYVYDALSHVRERQNASGFIWDSPADRSHQYHFFSSVLIWELFQLTGMPFWRTRLNEAIKYSITVTLRNGDGVYLGRGQEQIFGYCSLIYLLAVGQKLHPGRECIKSRLSSVCEYVEKFLSEPYPPLVMVEGGEKVGDGREEIRKKDHRQRPGWYAYNNYWDYIPFAGVMLAKALRTVEEGNDLTTKKVASLRRTDAKPVKIETLDGIVRVSTRDYCAVLSRAGGRHIGRWSLLTNELPLPYIVTESGRGTPCYGGDELQLPELFDPIGLPYPIRKTAREESNFVSIREGRVVSNISSERLWLLSIQGLLIRQYNFGKRRIDIEDWVFGLSAYHAYYLFERKAVGMKRYIAKGTEVPLRASVKFKCDSRLIRMAEREWCGGTLVGFRSERSGRSFRIRFSIDC